MSTCAQLCVCVRVWLMGVWVCTLMGVCGYLCVYVCACVRVHVRVGVFACVFPSASLSLPIPHADKSDVPRSCSVLQCVAVCYRVL